MAEADLAPDQLDRAVATALRRGLATEAELQAQAQVRGGRVAEHIDQVLARVHGRAAVAAR